MGVHRDDGGGDTRRVYERIADELRLLIRTRHYPPGVALPSERRLMQRYDVSRETVRHALAQLRSEGLISGERGAGNFVQERPLVLQFRAANRFITQAREQGQTAEVALLDVSNDHPPPEISERLDLPPSETAIIHEYSLTMNGEPMQYEHTYWPARLVENTALAGTARL